MLLSVSIVSSYIDVACHVNMHFQVRAEKKIKDALFHKFGVHLCFKESEQDAISHVGITYRSEYSYLYLTHETEAA